MQIAPAAQATPTGDSTPMAASSTPAPSGGAIGAITTVHLALIALFALFMLAVIGYGMWQRRSHRAAERQEQARLESLGGAASPPDAPPIPVSGQEDQLAVAPVPADPGALDAPEPVAPHHDPVPLRDQPVAAQPGSLTRIKGLGPKVQTRLAELGVTRVDQLAALTEDEANALDAELGAFRGRIARDRWVEQARFLAAGDVRGFEAVFGRL